MFQDIKDLKQYSFDNNHNIIFNNRERENELELIIRLKSYLYLQILQMNNTDNTVMAIIMIVMFAKLSIRWKRG